MFRSKLLNSMHVKKHLKKIGVEKEDYQFWKQVGKALLCTYTIMGSLWLYRKTFLVPQMKEEQELAHLHKRGEFRYPHNEEANKESFAKGGIISELIAKGGMISELFAMGEMFGNTTGPKGMVEKNDKDVNNNQKELESKEFEQEAQKLWLKMRNEVIAELQQKGIDVERVQ